MNQIKTEMETSIKTGYEQKQNIITTFIFWMILCIGGMAVMLYVAAHKPIVISDIAQEQTGLSQDQEKNAGAEGMSLLLQEDAGEKNRIYIPLVKGTKAENVVMENRYMKEELWIYLEDSQENFYSKNAIYGDVSLIQQGVCESKRDSIILRFQMQDVLEYKSTMKDDVLVIDCYRPKELYSLLVVVDPAGGGSDTGIVADDYAEKELTLEVSKKLQKQFSQEDIKLYFTRQEDEEVTMEDRVALAQSIQADAFISLGVSWDTENLSSYGIESYYNEQYFIPEFGNVQLADVLTKNVTISAGNRALGLIAAGDDSILQKLSLPSARVNLGYLSNSKERELLRQEAYQQKLAEGLANAVLEVYTIKNNE